MAAFRYESIASIWKSDCGANTSLPSSTSRTLRIETMIGMKRAGKLAEVIHDRQTTSDVRPPFLQLCPGKRQQVLRHAVRRQRVPFRHYLRVRSFGVQDNRLTIPASPSRAVSTAKNETGVNHG
jgi:hypothetical protein